MAQIKPHTTCYCREKDIVEKIILTITFEHATEIHKCIIYPACYGSYIFAEKDICMILTIKIPAVAGNIKHTYKRKTYKLDKLACSCFDRYDRLGM